MEELTERQKLLLSLIVHEHTLTAKPLRQPHTSAGRVPTEKGYRFFVSNLLQQPALPTATRNTITHQFYQARQQLDEWFRLAAAVLAKQAQAASIVTAPHSKKVAFKHLELISTRASQVLMVLVLVGGEIRQQIFSLDEIVTQQRLSNLAAELNTLCQNCTLAQLEKLDLSLDDVGNTVMAVIKDQMQLSERLVTGEIYLDGLTNVLAEPEFADTEQALSALSLFEERNKLDDLLSRSFLGNEVGDVQVLIGGEGTWEELRQCSLILSHYGIQDQLTGTLGILGPMRMPYGNAISTVRFVANLLSDLVAENLME